ncbi:MAG: response regulator [Lachnospiraceae bacterium]|nr:response regulator [Lachnospiraceae bacterium]
MESNIGKMMRVFQWILATFLMISIGYFIIGELFSEKEIRFKVGGSLSFNEGWEMLVEAGERVPISVPGSYDVDSGDTFVIENKLPQNLDGMYLCIRSSQQDIKIIIDGEVREDYSTKGSRNFGKNSVSVYIFAELYPEDAGKTIRMEMVSYSTYSGYVNEIFLGNREQIWRGIVKQHLPVTILALFMLLLSAMVVFYCIIIRGLYKKNMDIFHLGVGLLIASVWIIAESKLRQVFLPNATIASDVGFFMVMLLPFPFLLYLNKLQKSRYEKAYFVVEILTAINFVVATILQLANIKDFSETMGTAHLIIVLLILILLVTIIIDFRKGYVKEYKEVAFGLVGLMIAGLFEVYMVYDKFAIYNGVALCIGLAFLFFMAVIQTGRDLLQLEKDKQIAVAANESRAMFLANMSHEIRTPINTILGMNEMILRDNKNNETREYAKNIENASKMLLGLIDDILDFSKLDAGKLEISENPYRLSTVLNDVLLSVRVRLQGKNLDIKLNVDDKLPSVLNGDELRIKQIFNNLLSNAVKYTDNGSITISAKGEWEKDSFLLCFSVQDTGVGIREEDLPTLFESFRRMDLKRNKYVQGTGLGLNITKQLVTNMGGTIDVTSQYGKGSTFAVKIPQQIVDKTPIGDATESYSKALYESEEKERIQFAKGQMILVVDDNDMNLAVMKGLLEKTGLKLDFASSGVECIEKCKTKKYDLIFMDHMMPEPDGVETLHIIKADEEGLNQTTTVVVLTANAIKGVAEQYEADGFDGYLSKPVEYKKLETTLKRFLNVESTATSYTLDTAKGVKNCGDYQELYQEILGDYVSKCREYLSEIQHFYDSRNWKEYARIAHTLKSTSMTIGLEGFPDVAREHELAAKNEQIDFIDANYEGFLVAINNAIATVEKELK